MKKTTALLLTLVLAASAASCSQGSASSENQKETSASTTEQSATSAPKTTFTSEMKSKLDKAFEDNECEGSAYITENGKSVYEYASGKDLSGKDITVDTPLPVGSVSKQFCAAAIVKLSEEGKLSLDDKLDKYFPDFKEAGKVTLHNLLSMRSGILDVVNHGDLSSINPGGTYDENRKAVQDIILNTRLTADPDSAYEYSNSNYILLSAVTEQVTGEKYIDYLRKTFLDPLGMKNTGSADEFEKETPKWANGIDYKDIVGVATGAGDIISPATDMDKWMSGLKGGKVLSAEGFKKMTTDYSQDSGSSYGYGFELNVKGGIGHNGAIALNGTNFTAFDYIGEENSYNMILECSNYSPGDLEALCGDVLNIIAGE